MDVSRNVDYVNVHMYMYKYLSSLPLLLSLLSPSHSLRLPAQPLLPTPSILSSSHSLPPALLILFHLRDHLVPIFSGTEVVDVVAKISFISMFPRFLR
jgi:hypothetical protein